MNKSIVEGGEDTRDTEDKFTWYKGSILPSVNGHGLGRLTLSDLGAQRNILGGSSLNLLLGRHIGNLFRSSAISDLVGKAGLDLAGRKNSMFEHGILSCSVRQMRLGYG